MRNSRASLFLMELMISIMFFAISGAVCIQLFVKAHTINEESAAMSKATLIAQDICEYYHYSDGDKADMLSYYNEIKTILRNFFLLLGLRRIRRFYTALFYGKRQYLFRCRCQIRSHSHFWTGIILSYSFS